MPDRDNIRAELRRIDRHVGARLRRIRQRRGISQKALGAELGVTFQQIQKYESARNRISAGRLLRLTKICHVPLHYFFHGL
ncbi:helix-turn-helix domain-containing protein [Paremcibacter congregatus]|uniref:helix-turn-helix domain-containing protein n=1 Tax=Paremcibacter congregatus TaxID=2043170 RepID=UPI003A8DC664